VTCHNCSVACSKAGRRPDGMQRYRCGVCGKTFSDRVEHGNLLGQKQAVDDHKGRTSEWIAAPVVQAAHPPDVCLQ
jgi:hypothetical protein